MALRHSRAAASGIEVDFLYPTESTIDGPCCQLNHERTLKNNTTTPAIIALPIRATE